MAGFTGPEWEAGRIVNAGEPFLNVDASQLPTRDDQETEYRYLVSVGYQMGGRGTVYYATVEVLAEDPLFPEEIRERALNDSLSVIDPSNYTGRGSGLVVPRPADVSIIWAARRA